MVITSCSMFRRNSSTFSIPSWIALVSLLAATLATGIETVDSQENYCLLKGLVHLVAGPYNLDVVDFQMSYSERLGFLNASCRPSSPPEGSSDSPILEHHSVAGVVEAVGVQAVFRPIRP